jgi:hypothetical protein
MYQIMAYRIGKCYAKIQLFLGSIAIPTKINGKGWGIIAEKSVSRKWKTDFCSGTEN